MKSLLKICAPAALLLATLAPAGLADAPRPRDGARKPPSANATFPMRIQPNFKATEAKLLIPRAVWQQMRAGLDGGDAQSAANTARFSAMNGAQTIMAGIFLSLACACGGLWFVRARRQTKGWTSAALGVALLALCGVTANIAYANAGPPPVARSLTSQILSLGAQPYGAYGQVKVEITDSENEITLVLPTAKNSGASND